MGPVSQFSSGNIERLITNHNLTRPAAKLIHTSTLWYMLDAAQYSAAIFNKFMPSAVGTAGFQKGP